MKVGASVFCQNFYRTQRPDHEIYHEDLAIAELAEPLGFDSLWAVEHHFSPYTMIPDVLQFLTYICGRTRRIGLGTMVVVLPWHNPILLAEQAATLDVLSGGRLDMGVGKGYRYNEFQHFCVPLDEAQDRFEESVGLMKRAWTSDERFFYHSARWNFADIVVEPAPAVFWRVPALIKVFTPDWFARLLFPTLCHKPAL